MGPIAPKDPVKQREFFYIMYEKQISAAPAAEGKGVCFLYMDCGRMINLARMIGNVQDDEMLKMLSNTENFRKLVYGVGITMMTEDNSSADFVLQMYGKTDPYNSGTTMRQTLSGDGIEYLIPLSEVKWSDDDNVPGQIRFEFPKSGITASVSVRFYLNDGFKAPVFEPFDKVDTSSPEYKALIEQSLMSMGNYSRLKKVIDKAKAGEPVSYALIGGSITQGAGAVPIYNNSYAYKSYMGFKERFDKGNNSVYCKAGVGGTPSELGIVRYNRDVLRNGENKPDIVIIEFAVNDAGDETNGECYEGLMRTVLEQNNEAAVILLFSVFVDDYNLEERLVPIGQHYNVPMVSIKSAVTKQFYLSKENGRVIAKNLFFYDQYHPTNLGHTIMADSLINLFEKVDKAEYCEDYKLPEKPFLSTDFENISLIDRKENDFGAVIECGDFFETDKALQGCEMNTDPFTTPQFPYNWQHLEGNNAFKMTVDCRILMIVTKDDASPEAGQADVYVDGQFVKTVNPREIGWVHCNSQVAFMGKEKASHTIEVKMHEGDENKKFTILGFGIA